jgi:hypothetical protein
MEIALIILLIFAAAVLAVVLRMLVRDITHNQI